MIIKKEITAILNKQMDRQDFLKHVAIGMVALTGAGAALKLMAPDEKVRTIVTTVEKGYGGSAYGGDTDGKS
jgi:hypothetical protein